MANAGQLEARAALAEAIPKLASSFPPAPSLTGRTHFVHSSAHGATHWTFEAPEGETVRDYERLEVRTLDCLATAWPGGSAGSWPG